MKVIRISGGSHDATEVEDLDVDASSEVVRGLGLHLIEGSSLRFRHKDEGENQPEDGQDRVRPERPRQADILAHVHERLDAGERADVAEASGHRGSNVSVFQGENFSNEKPGDRVDAEAKRTHEGDDAQEGDPVKVGKGRRVELFVVGEDSESGQGQGHEDRAEDEERKSAEKIG